MCTYHLCFTGQIKFLNYNKIPQQGESIGNEASPKPHAGTASSSGGTIEESLVSLTLVDLATVRDTVKLKDLLLSSLVNLRSPLVHVLGSPLVHVAGNFAGKNSPLVHFAGNFAGKNSPLVHIAGKNSPLVHDLKPRDILCKDIKNLMS